MSLARDVDIFDPDVQKQFATRLLVKFLGTALVVKDQYAPEYRSTAEFDGNHLLALPQTSDLAYEYLLAAGWSEGTREPDAGGIQGLRPPGHARVQPSRRALRRPRGVQGQTGRRGLGRPRRPSRSG